MKNMKVNDNKHLSTTNPKKYKNKNKLSKQLEEEENHRNGDHRDGYQWGGGGWWEGTGNKKHKVQNRQGEVKNSTGNGEDKELICFTHGHELRGGMLVGGGVQGGGE